MNTEHIVHAGMNDGDARLVARQPVDVEGDSTATAHSPAWAPRRSGWTVADRGQPAWASRTAWS